MNLTKVNKGSQFKFDVKIKPILVNSSHQKNFPYLPLLNSLVTVTYLGVHSQLFKHLSFYALQKGLTHEEGPVQFESVSRNLTRI